MKFLKLAGSTAVIFSCIQANGANAADLVIDKEETVIVEPPVEQIQDMAKKSMSPIDRMTQNWFVSTNVDYANSILDYDESFTSKAFDQLRFRKDGTIKTGKVYVSGLFKKIAMKEKTNTENAFPILTRFPHHATGTTHKGYFLENAAIGVTATPLDWLTIYAQGEYRENIFDNQNHYQLRKAYVTFGDFNKSPYYVTVGRKTINFGDFDQYVPYTHNVNMHFFEAESDGPIIEAGFATDSLEFAATAISTGRHWRTADMPGDHFDFNNPRLGDLSFKNFALNANANMPVRPGIMASPSKGI